MDEEAEWFEAAETEANRRFDMGEIVGMNADWFGEQFGLGSTPEAAVDLFAETYHLK